MLHRIAAAIAATAAAVLLVSSPAWASNLEPVVEPSLPPGLATTEPTREQPPCVGEPFEIAPGEWDCVIEEAPTVDVPPADDEPEPVEPTEEPEPVIVEDNGGWGWSDAREMYAA